MGRVTTTTDPKEKRAARVITTGLKERGKDQSGNGTELREVRVSQKEAVKARELIQKQENQDIIIVTTATVAREARVAAPNALGEHFG